MPISPYYKPLYEDDDRRRYTLGVTPPESRYGLGTEFSPRPYGLGAERPSLPNLYDQPDQPELTPFQLARQRILPQGDDIDDSTFSVLENEALRPNDFEARRARILPRMDFDLGGAEPEQEEAPNLKFDMPTVSTQESPTNVAPERDRARTRELLSAIAQFTASAGNIGGTPTQTTTPDWMARQTALDQSFAQSARQEQKDREESVIRQMIRQNEAKKSQIAAEKAARDTAQAARDDDPMSTESQSARQLIKDYYSQYLKREINIPDTTSASVIYKLWPGLAGIVRGEMMGQFGLQQTQLKGVQAEESDTRKYAAQKELEDIKQRWEQIKNDSSEAAKTEREKLKGEYDKIIKSLELTGREKIVGIQGQTARDVANIGAKARIESTKLTQEGAGKRAAARVNKSDQYRAYKEVKGAMNEYKKDPIVRNYLDITNNVKALERNLANPTGIGDLATVYNFVKALDPGSVVREGEIALMQQAQGLKDQMLNILGRFEGKKFTPDMRATILAQMRQMQSLAGDNVRWLNDTVRAVAKEGNWSPESFLIKFGGEPGGGISVGGQTAAPTQPKIKVYKPGGAK